MKKIYLTVAEPGERNKVAETRFVSPREAEEDIATIKANAAALLKASEEMQRATGLPAPALQVIVDNCLAGAQYLFVTLGCARKNNHLLRCHLVAPQVHRADARGGGEGGGGAASGCGRRNGRHRRGARGCGLTGIATQQAPFLPLPLPAAYAADRGEPDAGIRRFPMA